MTADIYLKRKYLPRNHPSRRSGAGKRTQDILYYREIRKMYVRGKDNESYIEAIEKVLHEARKVIKTRNRYFEILIPSYDLNCIDFAKAHKQLEKRRKDE